MTSYRWPEPIGRVGVRVTRVSHRAWRILEMTDVGIPWFLCSCEAIGAESREAPAAAVVC